MKSFLIAVVLVAAVSADQYWEDRDWIDYRLDNRDGSTPTPSPPVCTTSGPMCYQCKTLYLCNSIGGSLVPIKVQDCSGSEEYCNVNKCSATPDPHCLNEKFECSEVQGMYPDPVSCKDFHYCVPPDPTSKITEIYSSTCGNDYSYNYKTTYCDKKLVNQTCPAGYPVPICTTLLQTAALKDNPSIYYVCMDRGNGVLYPTLYICDHGQVYNGNFTCK